MNLDALKVTCRTGTDLGPAGRNDDHIQVNEMVQIRSLPAKAAKKHATAPWRLAAGCVFVTFLGCAGAADDAVSRCLDETAAVKLEEVKLMREVHALSRRLQAREQELGTLAERVREAEETLSGTVTAPDEHSGSDHEDLQSDEELYEALEKRFEDEPVSPAWASEQERRFRRELGSRLPAGVEIKNTQCGSVTCRIEVTGPTVEEIQDFARKMFSLEQGAALREMFKRVTFGRRSELVRGRSSQVWFLEPKPEATRP